MHRKVSVISNILRIFSKFTQTFGIIFHWEHLYKNPKILNLMSFVVFAHLIHFISWYFEDFCNGSRDICQCTAVLRNIKILTTSWRLV